MLGGLADRASWGSRTGVVAPVVRGGGRHLGRLVVEGVAAVVALVVVDGTAGEHADG